MHLSECESEQEAANQFQSVRRITCSVLIKYYHLRQELLRSVVFVGLLVHSLVC